MQKWVVMFRGILGKDALEDEDDPVSEGKSGRHSRRPLSLPAPFFTALTEAVHQEGGQTFV